MIGCHHTVAGSQPLYRVPVDQADDVVEIPLGTISAASAMSPTLRHTAGVVAHADGMVVIPDPAGFLSEWEAEALERALVPAERGSGSPV